GADGILHRPFDQFGAKPVLVVGQPFIAEGLAQQPEQFIHIHADNFASF
ncbi:MAG: hypothetical protein H6Q56_1007, partial [Deltaproteobacteria bacterium]|nr:hypothetical protein [Deltaproteobacteria bacterium]